jgi:hypothetical protein
MSRKFVVMESENDDESSEDAYTDTDQTIEDETGAVTGEETAGEDKEDGPEEVVEMPEIGNLEVDAVYKENQEAEKKASEIEEPVDDALATQEVSHDAIDEAVTANDELTAIAESLMESARTNGSFDYHTTKIAKIALEARRKQLGFKDKSSNISLENFTDIDKSINVKVVMEGFMDTIKSIFMAIVNVIKKSIETIKKFFMDFLFNIKNDIEFTKLITSKVLKQRKDKEVKSYEKENYVINAQLASMLLIDNKQVSNYKDEFLNILNTIDNKADGGYSEFLNTFDDKFTKVIDEEIKSKLSGGKPATGVLEFTPFSFISKSGHGTVNYTATTNYHGRSAKEHYSFYVQKPTLGNMTAVHEIHNWFTKNGSNGLNNWEVMQAIKGWDINLIEAEIKGNNTGGIRYCDSKEIEDTSKVVLDIFYSIQNFETTIDKLNVFKTKLEGICKDASNHLNNYKTANNVDGIKIANAVVGTMSNVVRLMDRTTHQYIKYARSTGNMWSLYLKAVYKKENS